MCCVGCKQERATSQLPNEVTSDGEATRAAVHLSAQEVLERLKRFSPALAPLPHASHDKQVEQRGDVDEAGKEKREEEEEEEGVFLQELPPYDPVCEITSSLSAPSSPRAGRLKLDNFIEEEELDAEDTDDEEPAKGIEESRAATALAVAIGAEHTGEQTGASHDHILTEADQYVEQQEQLDEQEDRSKRNNLRIGGIPDSIDENWND